MDHLTKIDMEEAQKAISSMIERSEKVQLKFAPGTSQNTLLKNRIRALNIALSLITRELIKDAVDNFTKEEVEIAFAPIKSLISKSEKAQTKLEETNWQYKMLDKNLKALYIALSLFMKESKL